MKILCLYCFAVIFLPMCFAADFEAVMDSSNGTSGYCWKDSGAMEVGRIDSDGNLVIRGGMRLDASGVKCTTAEMLIVDGKVGIGTTSPAADLHVIGTVLGAAKDSNGIAQKIMVGKTPPETTAWEAYNSSTIYTDVTFPANSFAESPYVFTELGGTLMHYYCVGMTSLYNLTKDGFRIYISYKDGSSLTPSVATVNSWHIIWMAVGR
ncbi:MAG: hypothetical protein PHQ23_05595 [Candidatus Wallbacteria bacterium]|nr:hypothetical protein [Candidatus Wallbacteria bacterium]